MSTTKSIDAFANMLQEDVAQIGLSKETLFSVQRLGVNTVKQLAEAVESSNSNFTIEQTVEINEVLDEREYARFCVGA